MAENMTLGLSPCPNDTYIFHALLHHLVPSPAHFTPHMADVEELNALWYEGIWDAVHAQAKDLDELIDAFNEATGLLKAL